MGSVCAMLLQRENFLMTGEATSALNLRTRSFNLASESQINGFGSTDDSIKHYFIFVILSFTS